MTSHSVAVPFRSSSDSAFRELEAEILAGSYVPGQRLPSERQLADRFGISRPGVREMLRRFQERGLIEARPGLGSFVREIVPTRGAASLDQLVRRGDVTVRDLIVARVMLESESAALAAINRTETDATRMDRLLTAFDESRDISLAAELDIAFHEAIAVASGNPVLQIMFGAVRGLTQAMVLRSLNDRDARSAGAPIHHDILTAIVEQRPNDARAAMSRHITLAEDIYGADLDSPMQAMLLNRADLHPEIAELLRAASSSIPTTTIE